MSQQLRARLKSSTATALFTVASAIAPLSRVALARATSAIVLLSATLLISVNPVAAQGAKPSHNLAEGDNPALDEKALQDENSGAATSSDGTASNGTTSSNTTSNGTASGVAASDRAVANWTSLDSIVEKLIREYYPKAKIKPGADKIYVEYKAKPYILPSTNKQEQGPDWGGVVIDMQLQKGPYAGVHQVPKKFNEYSFYSVELYAPYSQKYDCHLLTRICYPFDVPQEFLKRFKKVVEDFEQYL
ncbi:hypothetical protein KF728_04230 [Candidatus Obscuribacterales bacterium]|nr:hypothetical protein [Candidatus Obscuribacterales bacterium]